MRSAPLKRMPVRVAISAKARPSAVVPTPTSTARNSVFQATPQRRFEVMQSSPQIEWSKNFAQRIRRARARRNCPSRRWPGSSTTGKKTKMTVSATTLPIAPTTKASPRHQPRAASPWQSSIRNDAAVSAAPKPMPAWLGPGAPNMAARNAQLQPLQSDREALQQR